MGYYEDMYVDIYEVQELASSEDEEDDSQEAEEEAEEEARQEAEEAARQAAEEEERQEAEEAERQAEEEARQAAEEARRAAAEEANQYMQKYETLSDYMQGALSNVNDNINLVEQWFYTYHQKLSSYPDSAAGKFEWIFNDACGRLEYDDKQLMNNLREIADNYQSKLNEINSQYDYWSNEYDRNNY